MTDGYYFNEDKSKCENGGALSFDKSSGKVRMSALASDKCYVYFDKEITSLGNFADYIKSLYTEQGVDNLYLHDSTLTNGARDNSYRYAGPHDAINNFVCFGSDAATCSNDDLYRIIGLFDDQVKLIKYDYATKEQLGTGGDYFREETPRTQYKGSQSQISTYYWNKNTLNGNWNEGRLNTVNLNGTYLTNLGKTWTDKIATTTWYIGGLSMAIGQRSNARDVYGYELGLRKVNKPYDAKIGLMYLSEYFYGALPTHWTKPGWNSDETKDYSSAVNENWMYMGHYDWTITTEPNATSIYVVNWSGNLSNTFPDSNEGVRPTFNLTSNVELASGSGSRENPFRIKI